MTMNTNKIIVSGATVKTLVSGNSSRVYLSIENLGSRTIYIAGSANITAGTGFPLLAGDALADTIYTGAYYGIGSAGENTTVNYIEED